MATTKRVKEILSWYSAENPGVLGNLARMLGHGRNSFQREKTDAVELLHEFMDVYQANA